MTEKILNVLSSLRLAVVVLLTLTTGLAAATFLESLYDTPTGKFWVYSATWFHLVLFMLGVNILAVMVDRWPWKKRHGPFLMAHIGILLLLTGSWVTYEFGLDGSIRLGEGESSNSVQIDDPRLMIADATAITSLPVKWTPPDAHFSPIDVPSFNLKVDQYITFADPDISFDASTEDKALAAVQVIVKGGPMRITQEYWMWLGDPSWRMLEAGPAVLTFAGAAPSGAFIPVTTGKDPVPTAGRPQLDLTVSKKGDLLYRSASSTGKIKKGILKAGAIEGQVIHPGWKGDVTITVAKWLPKARHEIRYVPSAVQYGMNAPSSAIHVIAGKGGSGAEVWLGLGDRATLTYGGRDIGIAYANRHVTLPFSIRLEQFTIQRYEGTNNPQSYSSRVSILSNHGTLANREISMNEPLEHDGVTFYQASYEDASPRPTVSIFTVNRDPGRLAKYVGSLLIVFGAIWLFGVKYRTNKKAEAVLLARAAANPPPDEVDV